MPSLHRFPEPAASGDARGDPAGRRPGHPAAPADHRDPQAAAARPPGCRFSPTSWPGLPRPASAVVLATSYRAEMFGRASATALRSGWSRVRTRRSPARHRRRHPQRRRPLCAAAPTTRSSSSTATSCPATTWPRSSPRTRKAGAAVDPAPGRGARTRPAFGCVPTDAAGGSRRSWRRRRTRSPTGSTPAATSSPGGHRRRSRPAAVSVERETFPGLIAAGELVLGYVDTAYWLDVGTPAAFVRGSCDLVLGALASPRLPGAPRRAPGARRCRGRPGGRC